MDTLMSKTVRSSHGRISTVFTVNMAVIRGDRPDLTTSRTAIGTIALSMVFVSSRASSQGSVVNFKITDVTNELTMCKD